MKDKNVLTFLFNRDSGTKETTYIMLIDFNSLKTLSKFTVSPSNT